jgi:hypothetical protein
VLKREQQGRDEAEAGVLFLNADELAQVALLIRHERAKCPDDRVRPNKIRLVHFEPWHELAQDVRDAFARSGVVQTLERAGDVRVQARDVLEPAQEPADVARDARKPRGAALRAKRCDEAAHDVLQPAGVVLL